MIFYRWFIRWGYILDELVISSFYSISSNPNLKKNDFEARLQSDNKKLTEYENIFDSIGTPHTWQLIEDSIELAEKSDLFRRETWRPFLKARRENVKVHKEYPDVLLFQT